jgi:hypothetical protein
LASIQSSQSEFSLQVEALISGLLPADDRIASLCSATFCSGISSAASSDPSHDLPRDGLNVENLTSCIRSQSAVLRHEIFASGTFLHSTIATSLLQAFLSALVELLSLAFGFVFILLAFLDRFALAAASLEGLASELDLVGPASQSVFDSALQVGDALATLVIRAVLAALLEGLGRRLQSDLLDELDQRERSLHLLHSSAVFCFCLLAVFHLGIFAFFLSTSSTSLGQTLSPADVDSSGDAKLLEQSLARFLSLLFAAAFLQLFLSEFAFLVFDFLSGILSALFVLLSLSTFLDGFLGDRFLREDLWHSILQLLDGGQSDGGGLLGQLPSLQLGLSANPSCFFPALFISIDVCTFSLCTCSASFDDAFSSAAIQFLSFHAFGLSLALSLELRFAFARFQSGLSEFLLFVGDILLDKVLAFFFVICIFAFLFDFSFDLFLDKRFRNLLVDLDIRRGQDGGDDLLGDLPLLQVSSSASLSSCQSAFLLSRGLCSARKSGARFASLDQASSSATAQSVSSFAFFFLSAFLL